MTQSSHMQLIVSTVDIKSKRLQFQLSFRYAQNKFYNYLYQRKLILQLLFELKTLKTFSFNLRNIPKSLLKCISIQEMNNMQASVRFLKQVHDISFIRCLL